MLGLLFGGIGAGINARINERINNQNIAAAATARRENYEYGEMAADAAYLRQRKMQEYLQKLQYQQYYDLESPNAIMEQLKAAGLSPSIYAAGAAGGGVSGISQASAPQGSGASGVGAPHLNTPDLAGTYLAFAQADKMRAEKELISAQAKGTETDNKIKDIMHSLKQIEFELYDIDYTALTDYVVVNGKRQSLYEFAGTFSSYEKFVKELRNMGMADKLTNTEQGQKALRQIFIANRDFKTQIAVLSEEETGANFQTAILNALKSKDFAELNAESAIGFLRKNIATNELTESQKDAWNNLLNKLGEKGSTTRDIAIILGMIINNFAHGLHYTNVSKSYNFVK